MAQIILSGRELISLLQANACVPEQITDIAVDDEEIKLKVRTDWPILKSIRVGMRFAGFDNGCVVLQLATNRTDGGRLAIGKTTPEKKNIGEMMPVR